jgi:hypothetical protein
MPASDGEIVNPKLGPPSAQFITRPVFAVPVIALLCAVVRWISAWTRRRREVVHEREVLNQPPRMSTECPETRTLERTWRLPLRASANELISAPAVALSASAGAEDGDD